MINKPLPFWGLNIRIPIIIPIKGKRFINQGATLIWGLYRVIGKEKMETTLLDIGVM